MKIDGLCWIKTPLFSFLQIVRRYSDFDLLNNSLQVIIPKHQWHTFIAWGILEMGWKWQRQEQEVIRFP